MSGGLEQILKLERFHHIVIGTQFGSFVKIRFIRFSGHDDNGSPGKPRVVAKSLADFKSQEFWHDKIEQNQIRQFCPGQLEAIFAIVGLTDGKPLSLKSHRDYPAKEIFIINNENFGTQVGFSS
jgi:hypothetical protein